MTLRPLAAIVLLVCVLLPMDAGAYNWNFDDEELVVGGLRFVADRERGLAECRGFAEEGETAELTVPATVTLDGQSCAVVSIGDEAFRATAVTTVTLSEGLLRVGSSAFMDTQLNSVIVPASVTEVCDAAFFCNTITEATILSTRLSMGMLLFGGAIQKLYMSSPEPPVLEGALAVDMSSYTYPLLRVYVPEGAGPAYRSAAYWNEYVIVDGEEMFYHIVLTKAGMLADRISRAVVSPKAVYNLTLSGPMDDDDFRFLKDSLTMLLTLDMKDVLCREMPKSQFNNSKLSTIVLPSSLQQINNQLFSRCNYIKEVVVPEGVTTIGNDMFYQCSGLKRLTLPSTLISIGSLYTYYILDDSQTVPEVEVTCHAFFPPQAKQLRSSLMGTPQLTLRVPAVSADLYQSAAPWNELPLETIDEVPNTLTVVGEHTLSTDALPDGFNPDLCLVAKERTKSCGVLNITGTKPLHLKSADLYTDVYNDRYWNRDVCSVALLTDAPVTSDGVSVTMMADQGCWHFMSFPFDVPIADVEVGSTVHHWVVRSYSARNRASGRGQQWIDVAAGDTLRAGQGYVWFLAESDDYEDTWITDLTMQVRAADNEKMNRLFTCSDMNVALEDHPSVYSHNTSWNFVGNPYPCYFDIRFLSGSSPILVWERNQYSYVAYSPLDDELILSPFEAFFIQKAADAELLTFQKEGRQKDKTVRTIDAARGNRCRTLVDLLLTADDGLTDRTRVVVNAEAQLGYETGRDAAKFFSPETHVPQLYTLVGSSPCAINERPESDGQVMLGMHLGATGQYTLSLARHSATTVEVEDRLTGITTLLTDDAAYTFLGDEGSCDDRFVLHIGQQTTGISERTTTRTDSSALYDLQGRRVDPSRLSTSSVLRKGRLVIFK